MNVIVVKDYEAMSKVGAEIIAKQIKDKPNSILGLATGGSPVGTYQNLIKAYQNKEISFKEIKTYNLDEYPAPPVTNTFPINDSSKKSIIILLQLHQLL